jgi:hypothetical protein
MKTLTTQVLYFLRQRPSRMNIANLLRFLAMLAALITTNAGGGCASWQEHRPSGCAPPNRIPPVPHRREQNTLGLLTLDCTSWRVLSG